MFNEKILEIQATIDDLTNQIESQRLEIMNSLDANDVDAAEKIKASRDDNQEKLIKAQKQLELYEAAGEPVPQKFTKSIISKESNELTDYRNAVNEFIHSKGAKKDGLMMNGKDEIQVPFEVLNAIDPLTDGVKKINTTPITADEISYNPEREVKTIVDLKQFTRIHPTTKGQGSYPILKQATTRMLGVGELEKNPALAKPEFEDINWKVLTYRGAIPLSQESIDDAEIDLVTIVQENIGEIKLNTTNYGIAETMKTFPAKTVDDFDDIKRIYNVDLDPAYNKSFVTTQSFYNFIDTLKDGNGRYLLQDSISSASGKVFSSYPAFVIGDDLLGAAGEAHAFIGDIKKAILFVDRLDIGLRWAENDIYGQYLQAVCRFDVKVADKNAAYFATYTPTP